MSVLLSAIVPLRALNNTPARFFGREAHAVFLSLLRRAAPTLAEELHGPRGMKPFTLSGILDPCARTTPTVEIRAGALYEWRITSFSDVLTDVLLERVLADMPRVLRFGPVTFEPAPTVTDSINHPWAAQTDTESFAASWLNRKTISSTWSLHFASPTTYRQGRHNFLLPDPGGIFKRYLEIWNLYAAPRLDDIVLDEARRSVFVSHYRLHTECIMHGAHPELGWMGHAGYTSFGASEITHQLQMLTAFALFCGTGYKTTQGMGQTQRLEAKRNHRFQPA